jgi:hypothetical protein
VTTIEQVVPFGTATVSVASEPARTGVTETSVYRPGRGGRRCPKRYARAQAAEDQIRCSSPAEAISCRHRHSAGCRCRPAKARLRAAVLVLREPQLKRLRVGEDGHVGVQSRHGANGQDQEAVREKEEGVTGFAPASNGVGCDWPRNSGSGPEPANHQRATRARRGASGERSLLRGRRLLRIGPQDSAQARFARTRGTPARQTSVSGAQTGS